MAKTTSEKEIEKNILEYLSFNRVFAWKNNSVGIYDPIKKTFRKPVSKYLINGVADILGILPDGRFLAIEVKTPRNNKRPVNQVNFINEVNFKGGLAFFANSVEAVKEELINKGYVNGKT